MNMGPSLGARGAPLELPFCYANGGKSNISLKWFWRQKYDPLPIHDDVRTGRVVCRQVRMYVCM